MFELLGAHPEIFPSSIKEPHYFVPGHKRTLREYLDLFSGATNERWLLEATPHYLLVDDTPGRIREFSPDSKAIVMVRDPVELLHSSHDLRKLIQREPDDLRTALGRADAERYWRIGRLGEQLERLFGAFPRDDIHVVVYDDFAADNAAEYRRVLDFLDVNPDFTPRFRSVNPSGEARSASLQRALWREDSGLKSAARTLLPRSLRTRAWKTLHHLNRRPRPRSPLDDEVARTIWLRLEPDVAVLSRLLDRDLVALWRR